MLGSLYYSSMTDTISGFIGLIVIIAIGYYCCKSMDDDSANSNRTYRSNRTRSYSYHNDEDELNYNWDDSWDDKWLHQGIYADDDHHNDEYTDYDPSWDEQWRH